MKKIYDYTIKSIAVLTVILVLAGCSSESIAPGQEVLHIKIKTNESTNYGNPLYMVVCQDNNADFVNSTVSTLYNSFTQQETGKYTEFINPHSGEIDKYFSLSINKPISIYFLFSSNSYSWKYRISNFDSDKSYTFYLGKSSIDKAVDDSYGVFSL